MLRWDRKECSSSPSRLLTPWRACIYLVPMRQRWRKARDGNLISSQHRAKGEGGYHCPQCGTRRPRRLVASATAPVSNIDTGVAAAPGGTDTPGRLGAVGVGSATVAASDSRRKGDADAKVTVRVWNADPAVVRAAVREGTDLHVVACRHLGAVVDGVLRR